MQSTTTDQDTAPPAEEAAPPVLGRVIFGAIFCVVATLGFIWLAAGVFGDRFSSVDDRIIVDVNRYWTPTLNRVMYSFTMLGDPLVLWPLMIGVGALLLVRRHWNEAIALAICGLLGGGLNQLLKVSYQRIRPDIVPSPFNPTSFSFPSGHAMGAMLCYGILAYLLARRLRTRWLRALVGVVAALLILAIGFSRVYFGVHYPTDIIGGYLAGAIWLVVSVECLRVLEWRSWRRANRNFSAS